MESAISIVIVTSPVKSNPDTYLIDTVIESLHQIDGLEHSPIIIVLDHYVIAEVPRPKSGRITEEMGARYEDFFNTLRNKYCTQRYCIARSAYHRGFAMSVKWGLEMCRTEFALIIQHDRAFSRPFGQIQNALRAFERHSHIRYIGFPTSSSANHDHVISERYRLKPLTEPDICIDFSDDFILKPLMFWYDSNHLCHVRRYLEIYRPFKNIPTGLKELFGGNKAVKDMILRNGDFIEDRFGQAQRQCLVGLREQPGELVRAFRWFGSYLICNHESHGSSVSLLPNDVDKKQTILVHHLRGRTYDPTVDNRHGEHGAPDEGLAQRRKELTEVEPDASSLLSSTENI